MEEKLEALQTRLAEIHDLTKVMAVLDWELKTYMPAGGAKMRARQMATVQRVLQERKTDPDLGRLIEALVPYGETLAYDSDTAALIRYAAREFEKDTCLPPAFVAEAAQLRSEMFQVWTTARPNNDFAAVQPYLERNLALSRQEAAYYDGAEHVMDPLIAKIDYGMTVAEIQPLFSALRAELVPLVAAIADRPAPDDSCLAGFFAEADQRRFGEAVIADFGFDFKRGRQDKTYHPFMSSFARDDARITTRFNENNIQNDGLFSTLHEAGHAFYELGVAPRLDGTPLARGASSGVHESQSRLWENQVGRGLEFWQHYYRQLQAVFPEQLGGVDLDTFYKAINKVAPGLIRTDADEVTYNLHVMIRFDLEVAMLEGRLAVKDLPDAWHARYESDLGVHAPSDVDGVLQDVHWYYGHIGGRFQGYTLGNIISALFYNQALRAHPEIPAQIAAGRFDTLHNWLIDNIYCHGRKFTAEELIERVTGAPLTITPYMDYLKRKFGALYNLT